MKKWEIFSMIVLAVLFTSGVDSQVSVTQNITAFVVPEPAEIVINEFVTNPRTDWDNSSSLGANDEWIELYNRGNESVNLTNWTIRMIDNTPAMNVLSAMISPSGYFVLLNPNGDMQQNGMIELYDEFGRLIDSVTYGSWNDGNVSDNAPAGNSNDEFDECVSRFPNGVDTNNDKEDFRKMKCTYGSENIAVLQEPINISNFDVPECLIESSDLTLSAEINGSIEQVLISINLHGEWENITLAGNLPGNYSYTISSENLSGVSMVMWEFIVRDAIGDYNFGGVQSTTINQKTELIVVPNTPNGLNGWYTVEPIFSFNHTDGRNISYRWNGNAFLTYSSPFGLELTPNNGNVTGGIHVMRYKSDLCNETEQEFIGNFDFFSPEIKNIQPVENSIHPITSEILISATIDEKFQSNSGINVNETFMFLDGNEVNASIENSGSASLVILFDAGNLGEGVHTVSVMTEDFSGRSSVKTWQFAVLNKTFFLEVDSPGEKIYGSKRVQFNVSTSSIAKNISYINHYDNNPKFKALCKNCNMYGKESIKYLTLREGENNITIRADDNLGNFDEKNIVFVIDSINPKITKNLPTKGVFSGEIEIQFTEQNPSELVVLFGTQNDSRIHIVDFVNECSVQTNNKYKCFTNIPLEDFDGETIKYSVKLTDISGKIAQSAERTVMADITPPQINSFEYLIEGKKVRFVINVTEANFKEITYINLFENNPKEKKICTKIINGICDKKINFQRGNHSLEIVAYDSAGNSALIEDNLLITIN